MENIKTNILFNELRSKINIVDVISHYLKLKKKGNNYLALCPFHTDNNPSLSVSEQKKIFKCFSCNVKGDVFKFVQMYKNISYIQAVKEVTEMMNIDNSQLKLIYKQTNNNSKYEKYYEINRLVTQYYQLNLINKDAKNANDYLKNRGLTNEIIKYFQIGYALNLHNSLYETLINLNNKELQISTSDLQNIGLVTTDKNKNNIDIFSNRIMFPIHDHNENVVGFAGRTLDKNKNLAKYINTETTEIFKKEEILYNFNRVKQNFKNEILYICEGYMDVISLYKLGIKNVVGLMGLNLSKKHIELIQTLKNIKEVVIALDNDESGINASIICAKKLLDSNFIVSIFDYKNFNVKDIDELINSNPDININTIKKNKLDYFKFLINREINLVENDLTPNDLLNISNKIFLEIKLHANRLLWKKYINILAESLQLDSEDLLASFKKINNQKQKFYIDNKFNKKYNNYVNFEIFDNNVQKKIKSPKNLSIKSFFLKEFNKEQTKLLAVKLDIICYFFYWKESIYDFQDLITIKLNDDFLKKIYKKLFNYYVNHKKITKKTFFEILENNENWDNKSNYLDNKNNVINLLKNKLIKFKIFNKNYSKKQMINLTEKLLISMNKINYFENLMNDNEHKLEEKDYENRYKKYENINKELKKFFNKKLKSE